jgi:hypothetical protein
MKAIVPFKICTVEIESESVKDLFREIATLAEVLNEEKCGVCGEEHIVPKTRNVEKNKKFYEYFEMSCSNPKCRARLNFGQKQDGSGIFPIRKLDANGKPDRENGSYGSHNGWSKYKGGNVDEVP